MNQRPLNMGDTESLIKTNDIGSERWFPISIDLYRNHMVYGYFATMPYHLKSNIAYSLQYLQFLEMLLRDLKCTNVIYSQIVKNFVIIAVSVIEVLFYHIAKQEGKIKGHQWRQLKIQDKKTFKKDEKTFKLAEITYEKLDIPEIDPPKFETLIQIVRDNQFLKSVDLNAIKPIIRVFRNMRNKVHLSAAQSQADNDYNTFNYNCYLKVKVLLFHIMNDPAFRDEAHELIFVNLLSTAIEQNQHFQKTNQIIYKWIN